MLTPTYFPLRRPRFADCSFNLVIDRDLRGRTFKAQVRKSPNDTGAALVTLNTVTVPNTLGVRLVGVETKTDGTKLTRLHVFIPSVSMAAIVTGLGLSAEELQEDNDIILSWDMQMTDALGVKDVILYGPFILMAGVTQ